MSVKFQPDEVARTDKPLRTDLTPGLTDPNPIESVSSEPEPVWKKWYLWVAIGVAVVAAAAVSIYFGTQPGRDHAKFCNDVKGANLYMNFSQQTCPGLF